MKKSLGVCIGASTVKIVEINSDNIVENYIVQPHNCNPRKTLEELFKKINFDKLDYITLTGRKFKELLNLASITEPEALENALAFINNDKKKFNALISLGSENFILYVLNKNGHIMNIQTGNKCASGTGEFFLQQIRRMNVSVDEAILHAENSDPHKVSGRCSVFCKSDCTHALNKGIPIGEVCAGLCNMMAFKIKELIKTLSNEDIVLVGGVTKNKVLIDILKQDITNIFIPEESDYFEALGAAVYAMNNKIEFSKNFSFSENKSAFTFLPPISNAENLVTFKTMEFQKPNDNDECIIGLDVGSTTTKAVLLKTKDDSISAKIYLRTNGDPVRASIQCYEALKEQTGNTKINVIGLGVTGSGRHIAGLHGLTDGIINEIIAHSTASVYFDKDVDTIFEIGGQDAKYTYITNSVASDYAMNEACSAGTGSFLEESAKESLGIDTLDIGDIALKGKNPPNFNDQCAAFISSDIKNASHEGIKREDIVAGLVYSICMNYSNRVKGERQVGKKIFMQGGVCYNKAIPLAMANLIKKPIIVPPEPGLMGAFGVAMEVKNRINHGILSKKNFQLEKLITRKLEYGKKFICKGTGEKCDRNCEISMIKIEDKNYPFGGICNKYYNQLHNIKINTNDLNFVKERERLVFEEFITEENNNSQTKAIGISKAFLTNTLYPLYFNFFNKLGFKVVLSDEIDNDGLKKMNSSFCFPAEISHGFFENLLKKNLDYIFIPHIWELYVENSQCYKKEYQSSCFTLQSEPYFLKNTFLPKTKILSPVLNFREGWDSDAVKNSFISIGREVCISGKKSLEAFYYAIIKQKKFFRKRKELGKKVLAELEEDKSKFAIVLFGRSYNAFSYDANMGIPDKFSSRNIMIVPYDCLEYEHEECPTENMNWATGQEILKAASFVKKHGQLFGTYITNFSCGPDSFLVKYFRDVMKTKPSLTLELDSHTADAGVTTRVEAFLDIIFRYRKINIKDKNEFFHKSDIVLKNKKLYFKDSSGDEYPFTDKRVKIIFPSMGRLTTEGGAAVFRGMNYNAIGLPVPDFETLMVGRANSSCKECLPLQLTTGSLMKYIETRKDDDQLLTYFMPTSTGSCRFTQYSVFMNKLLESNKIKNVALLTLTPENSYGGAPVTDLLKVIRGFIISDVMDDIKNALFVLAKDRINAMKIFEDCWHKIIKNFENGSVGIYNDLADVADRLSKIELKQRLSSAKIVLLVGEVYVRKDEFSCRDLQDRLAKKDIIIKRASFTEWLYYVDYIVTKKIIGKPKLGEKIELFGKKIIQKGFEKKVKKILSKSGLYHNKLIDIDELVKYGSNFVNVELTGETILVTGSYMNEIIEEVDGVISIGPFACMPTRVIESILTKQSVLSNKIAIKGRQFKKFEEMEKLPFLAIESDGNPFPQIIEARVEAFCLQVERLHKLRMKNGFVSLNEKI